MDIYLNKNKKNTNAWIFSSQFQYRRDSLDKSWEIIEEGKKYLPKDTLVEKQHNFIYQKKFVEPYRGDYVQARQYFNRKDYKNALTQLNNYLENVPDDFNARRLRVYTYYYLKEYQKGLEEANYTLTLSEDNAAILNIRGVFYRQLEDMDSACKDWEAAMNKGNADGKSNYERFCKNSS
jgi:Tfp pilus assembly protein PilF